MAANFFKPKKSQKVAEPMKSQRSEVGSEKYADCLYYRSSYLSSKKKDLYFLQALPLMDGYMENALELARTILYVLNKYVKCTTLDTGSNYEPDAVGLI